jgi:hypothetical protein
MSSGRSSDNVDFGAVVFGVFILIGALGKGLLIALGAVIAVAVVFVVGYTIVTAVDTYLEERKRAEEAQRRAKSAAAKQAREQRLRREKQERITKLGNDNAQLLEAAMAAAKQVAASEAAQTGWLGDVDFSVDIQGISDTFEKAHALRGVTGKLSALKNPSADDRAILAEAKKTIADLERAAIERVELIRNCATEAKLIDQSLKTEREDARVAEERAELHAKLRGMLYGLEATPVHHRDDSAVDAVMARVAAYREIKERIQQAR